MLLCLITHRANHFAVLSGNFRVDRRPILHPCYGPDIAGRGSTPGDNSKAYYPFTVIKSLESTARRPSLQRFFRQSEENNTNDYSEYQAPDDFRPFHEGYEG